MILDSINNMKKSKGYEKDVEGLSKMLISESYSSEAIKHRLNSELPILKDLYSRLAMIESKNSSSFILAGNPSMSLTTFLVKGLILIKLKSILGSSKNTYPLMAGTVTFLIRSDQTFLVE